MILRLALAVSVCLILPRMASASAMGPSSLPLAPTSALPLAPTSALPLAPTSALPLAPTSGLPLASTSGLPLAPAAASGVADPATAARGSSPSALDRVVDSVGPGKALHLVALLTLASLAPAIILVCTCFTRFVVVFSFLRTGIGAQAPPSQVVVGLALFMTLFVMAPIGAQVYERGVRPYLEGGLTESQALEAATPPLRDFLIARTRPTDLSLFYDISGAPRPTTVADVPLRIAVPAFVVSELNTAFKMGLMILLPFLVIDLVVASVLSALGMVMLPPPIVALPIKLLVFVAIDGWHLIVASLLRGAVG